jgi:hypothetical protein
LNSQSPGAESLVRRADFVHILQMIDRPCRANADLKRIWQLLLPDTPFPACAAPADADAAASENSAPLTRDDAEARRDFPRRRRD